MRFSDFVRVVEIAFLLGLSLTVVRADTSCDPSLCGGTPPTFETTTIPPVAVSNQYTVVPIVIKGNNPGTYWPPLQSVSPTDSKIRQIHINTDIQNFDLNTENYVDVIFGICTVSGSTTTCYIGVQGLKPGTITYPVEAFDNCPEEDCDGVSRSVGLPFLTYSTHNFTITITNGSSPAPLTVTTPAQLPDATANSSYKVQLEADGGVPTYTWKLAPGSDPLPAGLTLSSSGLLSGKPVATASATATFTVEVIDKTGDTFTTTFYLNLSVAENCSPLQIVNPSHGNTGLGILVPGLPATLTFTANCGKPGYSWDITVKPNGMSSFSCTGDSCTLSGTPAGPPAPASDLYFSTLTVRDSSSPPQQDSLTFSVEVQGPSNRPPLKALTIGDSVAWIGYKKTYDLNNTISGGTGPYQWTIQSVSPPLPSNFNINTQGGVGMLSGTFTKLGRYIITARVVDQNDETVSVTLIIDVTQPKTATQTSPEPSVDSGGIEDTSGGQQVLTPGGEMSIHGKDLTEGTFQSKSLPLPSTDGHVQVTVNGENAPIYSTSPTEIHFQTPNSVVEAATPATSKENGHGQGSSLQSETAISSATPTATVLIYRDGVPSAPITVPVSPSAPSISLYGRTATIVDPVIKRSATNKVVTPAAPAMAGDSLFAYGTGIGATTCVTPAGTTAGTNCLMENSLEITFPDYPGLNSSLAILFAGLKSGAVGQAQYNFKLPPALPIAAMMKGSIRLRIGDPTTGQTVNLYVKNTLTKPTTVAVTAAKMITAEGTDSNGQPNVCAAPTPGDAYKTTDALAQAWYMVNGAQVGDVAELLWSRASDGAKLTSTYNITLSGSLCLLSTLQIAGGQPASDPGYWEVHVSVNGGWLFTLPFTVSQ